MRRNLLILIDEENHDTPSIDQFLYLILTVEN